MVQKHSSEIYDIEEIHKVACQNGEKTYTDPSTGFMCFTELAHLKRGVCCGSKCRHCPYGWTNVRNGSRRAPKIISGDREAARLRMKKLQIKADEEEKKCDHAENQTRVRGRGGRHGGTNTDKNVPYTRGGDTGTSQLLTGERRSKDNIVFEAMGTVDELCAIVGVAHAELHERGEEKFDDLSDNLLEIMSRLFDVGSHIAKPRRIDSDDEDDDEPEFRPDGVGGGFDIENIEILEEWIDKYTEELPELTSFILPTGSKLAAQLHVARTICRRAERCTVVLIKERVCDPNTMKYLNRLSDFFFTASRYVNLKEGKTEFMYCRPTRKVKQRECVQVPLTG